ncbi:MAG: hypothetical protein RLZZ524_1233 [Pseudomonadota bacterium]|jgi:hypothetical protein
MDGKTAREPHPGECTGCRHSLRYATILEGKEIHDGLCLRPRAHTVWGQGCRHYSEAVPKKARR